MKNKKDNITRTKLPCNHEYVTYNGGKWDWTEWISPKMKGYKMKCCACGLVHEIDFKIVEFIGDPDKDGLTETKPITNKNIQVIWRLRRK